MRLLAASVIGSLGLLLAMASPAIAETYVYTGNPYTQVINPPYTTADFVSGSITLSSALAPNLVNFDAASLITEVIWNDGDRTFHILPETPVNFFEFQVSTDGAGHIITWDAAFSLIGFQTIGTCNDPGSILSSLTCTGMSADPFFGLGGVGDWNALFCNPICDYSFVVDNPGSWTSDAAPPPVPTLTPLTLALLGILLGASGMRRLAISTSDGSPISSYESETRITCFPIALRSSSSVRAPGTSSNEWTFPIRGSSRPFS